MKSHLYCTALVLPLWFPLGCGLGPLDELADAPVCDEQGGTVANCPANVSSSSTGDATPTTSGTGDGVETTTLPASETTTGGSTGDMPDEPIAPPTIQSVELDPDTLKNAAPITVQVEALYSDHVTMSLDGAEPVTLAASGANFYKGVIQVHGASMNGDHTVVITASRDALKDVETSNFSVHAPTPGKNIWLRTSSAPDSMTRAIAVDSLSNVYEVATLGDGGAARLGVSKRDADGDLVWPGAWLTYTAGESRAEDVAVGPDGTIYVLGNVEDGGHTRWWLAQLDPAVGILKGDPQLGEVDEPARGLSIAPNGDLAIVGYSTVWGEQDTDDVRTKVWFLPGDGEGLSIEWGYSPNNQQNLFAEVPEDVLFDGERIYVTGSVDGVHPDAPDEKNRKRSFVIEVDLVGEVVREHVAGGTLYATSGGYALAPDGEGGVVAVGWACNDTCVQVGEIQWFAGDGALEPYARQEETGKDGPAFAVDVAYNPAGYNVVASAVSMGANSTLGLRVTGRRPDDSDLVLDYVFDTGSIELGQAVAVGSSGYVWFAGARWFDNAMHALVGRDHG